MDCKALLVTLLVIVCHACGMGFAILSARNRTLPYVTLFEWLFDASWMYVKAVIATESVFMAVNVVECFNCCWRKSDAPRNCIFRGCNRCFEQLMKKFKCNCDTSDDSKCNICFDVIILIILIVGISAQIFICIISTTYVDGSLGPMKGRIEDDLYEWVTEFYGLPDRLSITETINDLQIHERCCGVYNSTDYNNSAYTNLPNNGGQIVPLTCYRIPEEGINAGQEIDESEIYDKGCLEALIDVYYDYFYVVWNCLIITVLNLTDFVRICCNIHETRIKRKNKVAPESSARDGRTERDDPEAHTVQMETPKEMPEGTSSSNDKHLPPLQYRSVKRFIAPDSSTTGQRKETPAGKLKTLRMYDVFDDDSLVARITSEEYFKT